MSIHMFHAHKDLIYFFGILHGEVIIKISIVIEKLVIETMNP